jgi:hypothetical protein
MGNSRRDDSTLSDRNDSTVSVKQDHQKDIYACGRAMRLNAPERAVRSCGRRCFAVDDVYGLVSVRRVDLL